MVTAPRPSAGESPAEVRERLRALIRRLESRPTRPRPAAGTEAYPQRPRPWTVTEVFSGAERRETAHGPCWVIEVVYPLDHHVGRQPLHEVAHVSPQTYALLAPEEGAEDAALDDLLFIDIESTGLGGAGALAFLVATGRLESRAGAQGFVLRQYLATSPPEEGAVLAAVLEDAAVTRGEAVLVSYNGRAFDAPMLDERATMHRMRAGFDALRHVDLLAPVRTGLRGAMPSCRLGMVETEVLGATRPTTEVGGADVPGWYFRFLRTGDARLLTPIVEHNAQDVVALGAILARFAALHAGAREPEPLDAVAMGRLHAARGLHESARGHLERALDLLPPCGVRDDTLDRLATLHRRAGRRDLALPLWREAAARAAAPGGPTGGGIRPLVEVAKALEHDRREFLEAIEVVDEALRRAAALARLDPRGAARWREALEVRRARLGRRAARVTA
ncbi:MAG: ribonuclease H-like domain-containing protein [Dehalococcoidia bacterium]|nr:ribonuclease H-like domain-containing protein [Dehalococcoidia bacterium]